MRGKQLAEAQINSFCGEGKRFLRFLIATRFYSCVELGYGPVACLNGRDVRTNLNQ